MLKKSKRVNSSQTLKQFQSFVKKRLQKKNILESQHQSIDNKINCFQQLLKLTKTGNSVANNTHKSPYSTPNCMRSHQEKRKQETFSEVQENAQIIAHKLDKMVHDTNCWVNSNKYPDLRKYKEIQKNQENLGSTQTKTIKKNNISLHKYTKPYLVTEDREAFSYLNRKKLQLSRGQSSKYLSNNRKAASKTIDISTKIPDFSDLRNEIMLYQTRAKQKYGLTFQKSPPNEPVQDLEQFIQPQDDKQMMRVISINQMKRQSANEYKKLVIQHTKQDSSIPTNLLGIIRSASAKTRKINPSNSGSRYIRI